MTATTTSTAKHRSDTNRYLELVRRFPLRPIRNKRAYAAATKVMEELAVRGEDDLNKDELDYLDILTDKAHTRMLSKHFKIGAGYFV